MRVLLVDDDPVDTLLISTLLGCASPRQFVIKTVSGPADAVAALDRERFDVCLLDASLAPVGGLPVMDEFVRRGHDVPVILLAGCDDRTADLEAERRGAYHFLVKYTVTGPLLERTVRYAVARRRAEVELARSALFDDLTGLSNRRQFLLHLERAAERAIRHDTEVCVAFLDLDGFKLINDRCGHAVGDEVLRWTAARIETCVRREDVAARLAGDEFAILFEVAHPGPAVDQILNRVQERMGEPIRIGAHTLTVGVSIGVAWFPSETDNIIEALKLADLAMYRAKQGARSAAPAGAAQACA